MYLFCNKNYTVHYCKLVIFILMVVSKEYWDTKKCLLLQISGGKLMYEQIIYTIVVTNCYPFKVKFFCLVFDVCNMPLLSLICRNVHKIHVCLRFLTSSIVNYSILYIIIRHLIPCVCVDLLEINIRTQSTYWIWIMKLISCHYSNFEFRFISNASSSKM